MESEDSGRDRCSCACLGVVLRCRWSHPWLSSCPLEWSDVGVKGRDGCRQAWKRLKIQKGKRGRGMQPGPILVAPEEERGEERIRNQYVGSSGTEGALRSSARFACTAPSPLTLRLSAPSCGPVRVGMQVVIRRKLSAACRGEYRPRRAVDEQTRALAQSLRPPEPRTHGTFRALWRRISNRNSRSGRRGTRPVDLATPPQRAAIPIPAPDLPDPVINLHPIDPISSIDAR